MELALRLLVCTTLAIGLASWRFVWGTRDQANWFHGSLGYYWMWILLVFLGYAVFKISTMSPNFSGRVWRYLKSHKGALVLIAGCSLFLHVHEPHEFKVLYDEPSHLQISQMMHLEGIAMCATRSHFLGDHLIFLNITPPFRQYFFPFLLSLGHDLFGYSTAAPFILNAILGLILLILVYAVGCLLLSEMAGVFAVLLFTAVPLLAQSATSGGYDVLNLVIVAVLPILGFRFLRAPSSEGIHWMNALVAFVWAASQVRYESLLYFIPIGVFIFLRWVWRKEWVVTWPLVFMPLGLLPSFASNMILMKTDALRLPNLRVHGESFMGLDHFLSNFQDLLVYFYSASPKGTGNIVVALIGTIGCATLFAHFIGRGRSALSEADPLMVSLALFASAAVAYVPALLQFWASPLDGMAARFTLPLWWCLCLGGGWLLGTQLKEKKVFQKYAVIALSLLILIGTARANADHNTTDLLVPSRVERWFLQFAASKDRHSTLFVSKSSVELIAHGYASIPMDMLNARPEKAINIMQAGVYKDIYILERSEFPSSKEDAPKKDLVRTGPNILTEQVLLRSFSPGQRTRILRFTGYRKEDGTAITLENAPPLVADFENDIKRNTYVLELYP